VLVTYEVNASDLGAAIGIAQRRALNDGYSHVQIQATKQVGTTSWRITVFAANSANGYSQRPTPSWVTDARGPHWHGPNCPCGAA